jgi:ankyrin repeat protein
MYSRPYLERVNHVDKLARQTPLYYAARRGHLQMAALLIEKGADVTVTDSSNKTVVDYAKKAKFFDVADFLGN